MYPGLIFWWTNKQRQQETAGQRGLWAGCGTAAAVPGWSGQAGSQSAAADGCGEGVGGSFGVRRPLRFLAYKLQLTDPQVADLARILNELKTERAQADVDDRRALAGLADAVAGGTFEEAQATSAATLRVAGTQRLQEMVVKSLGRIHALLNSEQRATLAYLIRTGTLTL
jgi:Spy/CpxP family protein refolding chaperone